MRGKVCYGGRVHVVVDLRAVRPGRLAGTLSQDTLGEAIRDLRTYLRGAQREPLDDGIRLVLDLDTTLIAALADEVRALANSWPFLSFRLLADPPACCLEVTGTGPAAALARVVFSELGR